MCLVCCLVNLAKHHGELKAKGMPEFFTVAIFSMNMLLSLNAKSESRKEISAQSAVIFYYFFFCSRLEWSKHGESNSKIRQAIK